MVERDQVLMAILGARALRALAGGGRARRVDQAWCAFADAGHPAFDSIVVTERCVEPRGLVRSLETALGAAEAYVYCGGDGHDRLIEELRSAGSGVLDDEPWMGLDSVDLHARRDAEAESEAEDVVVGPIEGGPSMASAPDPDGLIVAPLDLAELGDARALLSDVFEVEPAVLDRSLSDHVLAGPGAAVLGASLDDELIGVVATQRVDEAIVITELAVVDPARGHRVGSRLVGAVIGAALADGLLLIAVQAAPEAAGLYQRLGFDVSMWCRVLKLSGG